jgi:hypothetical protein
MTAKRITSGVIDEVKETISWGLPQKSDYNPPGKPWSEYIDREGRPLEAMAWCVEKQKSWTAEDPKNDTRSVRLQVDGAWEDFHHMEPVLVRKADLYLGNAPSYEYPRGADGRILWQDNEYAVVAVIKIHFKPHTIRIGSPETRLIKRLSRTLGTGLLSLQLREQSLENMRRLAQDKLDSCNILADSLRNTFAKSGLIFSLIKLELSFLRQQWEAKLLEGSAKREMKSEAIYALNTFAEQIGDASEPLVAELIGAQQKFQNISLPPKMGANWLRMRIEEPWYKLVQRKAVDGTQRERIREQIACLKSSLYLGQDPELLAGCKDMADGLKDDWVTLIYYETESVDLHFLEKLIRILENPLLKLPGQEKSRKCLVRLKALAETVEELEQNTNVVLREILNGNEDRIVNEILRKEAV